MKLMIQVPCFNEEKTLSRVLKELPKEIKGISKIEVQIIDDGSTDKTAEIAGKAGVNIVGHKKNRGLGVAFASGLERALTQGVDILVNTDADNQYPGKFIKELVKPIVQGEADIVIGNRQTDKIRYFSFKKKLLQKLGSGIVRYLSGTNVPDAVSGFRAYSKEAMLELNPISKFSYCIDTIVQAGKKGLKIVSIPIITNPPVRESRLHRGSWNHVKRSAASLLRVFAVYEPFKTFLFISILLFTPAAFFLLRFVYFYLFFPQEARGHIQSLIVGSAFLMASFQMFALAIVADLIGINRKLIETVVKKMRL